jgi:uncharacterized membrane protein YgcG
VVDESGPEAAGVLADSDAAAVLDCAKSFGARAGADRVVVVLLDEPQSDFETETLARTVFEQDPRDNQLVLVENTSTRYVWVEVGGSIRHHVGADSVAALTAGHVPEFRQGPRQGICATLAEAGSHVNGFKRIPLAGWIAGIVLPLIAAGAFVWLLARSYQLKTAKHVYDLRLAHHQHLESEDVFVREYQTRVSHDRGSPGGGRGGGAGRSSGGGTHF